MFTWPTPLKYPESKPSTPLTPLKYPECTWTWTRGTLVEVARGGKQVHRGNSRGVLASLLVNIALKLHSEESKYTSAIASVYLDMDSGYLSGVSGVLGSDSGYLSGVGQVNILSRSTYTKL